MLGAAGVAKPQGCFRSSFCMEPVENALSILQTGHITTSPGICGQGIYAFLVDGPDKSHLLEAWERGTAGGYNRGAAILMRCSGVLVKTKWDDIVPEGAVGKLRDQYAASVGSVTYVSVTFNTKAVIGAIGDHMDAIGYSRELHDALESIQIYMKSRRTPAGPPLPPPKANMRLLQNALVLGSNKPTQKAAKPALSADADDAMPAVPAPIVVPVGPVAAPAAPVAAPAAPVAVDAAPAAPVAAPAKSFPESPWRRNPVIVPAPPPAKASAPASCAQPPQVEMWWPQRQQLVKPELPRPMSQADYDDL